jgi:hypothetical protein
MVGIDLLIGHLVGDYLFQFGWMAQNKKRNDLLGWLACLAHCLVYTLVVMWCTQWTGLLVFLLIFLSHLLFDKAYIAIKYMDITGLFAYIPRTDVKAMLLPYILIDNSFHLVSLFLIALYIA